MMFLVLGFWSECSGVFFFECEVEWGDRVEGVENKISDKVNNNWGFSNSSGGGGSSKS